MVQDTRTLLALTAHNDTDTSAPSSAAADASANANAAANADALAATGPEGRDARGRLLRALGQIVQQRPEEPWTYCIAAREFITLCENLCADEACRKQVQFLRRLLVRATSIPAQSRSIRDPSSEPRP